MNASWLVCAILPFSLGINRHGGVTASRGACPTIAGDSYSDFHSVPPERIHRSPFRGKTPNDANVWQKMMRDRLVHLIWPELPPPLPRTFDVECKDRSAASAS